MVRQLLVFPQARYEQVSTVRGELEHRGGTEELSLVIVRKAGGWHVSASGLSDRFLRAGSATFWKPR